MKLNGAYSSENEIFVLAIEYIPRRILVLWANTMLSNRYLCLFFQTFLKDKGYLQAFDKNIGQIQSQKSIQDAIRRFQAYVTLI